MEYFQLELDPRIHDAMRPVGLGKVLTPERLSGSRQDELKEMRLQFEIEEQGSLTFTDFIGYPVPLLSDALKRLIKVYDPSVPAFQIGLIDTKRQKQELYWLLLPPKVRCLSGDSRYSADGRLQEAVLDQGMLDGSPLIRVEGAPDNWMYVHLGLAESMLRRDFYGIKLNRANMSQRASGLL